MVYKIPELKIDENNPFVNCKLGRKQYADILTKIVGVSHGCVFAIDGEWGSGKTTFVKMWKQCLINEGFHVLYFNVWEHDFITDPIIGLVSQFRDMADGDKTGVTFSKISTAAGKVVSGIFPAIIKGVAKKTIGEDAADVLESAAKTMSNSFDKIIDKYVEQGKSMEEFRKALENLVESVAQEEKPLIFIIDELDRCNPQFAVKVLERVKHLFNVPNIVFVLSIDKAQLCHSICGYYGSENLDAKEYLKRFIDIEYKLPEPNIEKFLTYLYEVYGFDVFFTSESRRQYFRRSDEKEEFLRMSRILFEYMRLNLRQMEKICAHIRLTLQTFHVNQYVNPAIILMLMCFRDKDNNFYNRILKKSLTAQELLNHIEEILPDNIFIENEHTKYTVFRHAVWETARLVFDYNLNMNWEQSEVLIKKIQKENSSSDVFELLITPKIIPKDALLDSMKWYNENILRKESVMPLDYVTQHIELLTPLQ